jgi:Alkylmercury lyase
MRQSAAQGAAGLDAESKLGDFGGRVSGRSEDVERRDRAKVVRATCHDSQLTSRHHWACSTAAPANLHDYPVTVTAEIVEDLRLLVYNELARLGRVDSISGLAAALTLTNRQVVEGLRVLHDTRDLVLDENGEIVLAHPFATRNFGFSVMGASTIWWGGCAWDAFAIPHLVPHEPDTVVATQCPCCRKAHAWNVTRSQPPIADQVVYFATPMARVWEDVVHACLHQRIYCDAHCLDEDLASRGAVDSGVRFDVLTLWKLAQHWYTGRLDRGYQRRDPAAASAYFAEVGLTGPFWGSTTTRPR